MRSRIAVLASGGGTNLEALLEHLDALGEKRAGDVVVVASDRRDARALARATARRVPTAVVQTAAAAPGTQPLDTILRDHRVDLVALAGYLRLVPADIVERYRGRVVNVHPALLPTFGGAGMYGARVHQAVLDAGATVSGVTVHFVDQVYDRGPVIAQWPVPVLAGDTTASLAARVLRVEHVLYPIAVNAVAAGQVALAADGSVHRLTARAAADAAGPSDEWAFTLSTVPGPRLASEIARAIGA
ncbi:MAG: phosphoribosylglycinamide formyltransferase [Gemmatimonadota bacterium]|nr:phosphoribosylglycinamide formyltransferase [Gemmatimonadota bacterium]